MSRDPEKRPTTSEILSNPIFNDSKGDNVAMIKMQLHQALQRIQEQQETIISLQKKLDQAR